MVKLIAFDTEEELMELTGLSEDELWENGTFKSICMITTFRTKMSKDLPSGTK